MYGMTRIIRLPKAQQGSFKLREEQPVASYSGWLETPIASFSDRFYESGMTFWKKELYSHLTCVIRMHEKVCEGFK